jgi:integrase
MGRKRIPSAEGGADHQTEDPVGPVARAGKSHSRGGAGRSAKTGRTRERLGGIAVKERNGFWHLHGRLRIGRRVKRVRESTSLPATAANWEAAEELRRQKEQEVRNEFLWGKCPSERASIAIDKYLNRKRKRPFSSTMIRCLKEVDRKFGPRELDEIPEADWIEFVDKRMARNSATTREGYIGRVLAFLNWCKKRPRRWIGQVPAFEHDREARCPKHRRARRVGDLRPELIALLIESASPHYKGQMAIHWTAGARVSSIIYHCRYCDYLAVEGREQITFHDTKNGDDVTAVVHPWAATVMREYLKWRGVPKDREEPLLVTHFRRRYRNNGHVRGGQTTGAFHGMVRRASASLRCTALREAAALRRRSQGAAARAHWAAAQADIALLAQLTPHWFRHLLATSMMAEGDLRSVMEQGGWRSMQSVLAYMHDVQSRRRAVVGRMAAPVSTTSQKGLAVRQNVERAEELTDAEARGQSSAEAPRSTNTSVRDRVASAAPRQRHTAVPTEGGPIEHLDSFDAARAQADPPLPAQDDPNVIIFRSGRLRKIADAVLVQISQDEYEVRKGECFVGVVRFFNGQSEWG